MRHGRLLRMQCSGVQPDIPVWVQDEEAEVGQWQQQKHLWMLPHWWRQRTGLVVDKKWNEEKNESKAILSRWVALKLVKLPLSVLQHCGACGLATKGLQFFKLIVVQQTIKTHPRRIKVRSHTMSAILCYGSVKSGFRTHATHGSQIHQIQPWGMKFTAAWIIAQVQGCVYLDWYC